jgi:hypothetical protein
VSSDVVLITDALPPGEETPQPAGELAETDSAFEAASPVPGVDRFEHDVRAGGFVAGLLFAALSAIAVVMVLFAPPLPVRVAGLALLAVFGPLSFARITRRGGTR